MTLSPPPIRSAPLGPQTQPPMVRHDVICVHTMVGYLVSTDPYFRTSNGAGYDGTESHFGVGGKWGPDLGGGLDGDVWQWQGLARTADANYQGNPRVISIETADNAARPIQPWTPAQLSSLIRLIAWLCTPAAHAHCPADWACHKVGIPATLIPDTQSHRRGLAYHAQGAADHTVGEWWSTTQGKDCPTDVRIAQFRQVVIPGVRDLLAFGTDQEDDMTAQENWDYPVTNPATGSRMKAGDRLVDVQTDLDVVKAEQTQQGEQLDRIEAALAKLTPTPPAGE